MAASMLLQHCRQSLLRIESRLWELLGFNEILPALAVAGQHTTLPSLQHHQQEAPSMIDAIRGTGFLWASVPKHRRSLERRMTRRMRLRKHYEYAMPKKNIIACLECGHWHERHTLCGNCYDKVRQETKDMQATMPEDDRLYNTPRQEVVFLYKDELAHKDQHDGKYIVEMPKKKPMWWANNLLTKANSR